MSKIIEAKSSSTALIFNGKPFSILRPWRITIDVEKKQLTVKRRNWHFFSFDENISNFRSIRNVKVDTHIFGADIEIKVHGAGTTIAYYISKKKAKQIRSLLMDNDWTKNDTEVAVDFD